LSHCGEKAAEIGRWLSGFGGSLRMLLGEGFEVFYGGAALGVFEVEIVQQGFKGGVAHLRANHVEDHGAFVHDDGAIVGGVGRQARSLGDRRGFFVH